MTVCQPVQEAHILIPDDFSQRLKKILPLATMLAKCFPLKMKAVGVITFKRNIREQQSQFAYFLNKAFKKVE